MDINSIFQQLGGFEISCLTLLVGVVVATILRRFTGVNPGGSITAPFIILASFASLYWACAILLVSFFIAKIYPRLFSRIYHGRSPMFIMALMSAMIMFLVGYLMQRNHLIMTSDINYLVGIIIPAIIANAVNKQGAKKTYIYTMLAVLITGLIMLPIYYIGISFGYDFFNMDRLIVQRQVINMPLKWLLALSSIVLSFIFYLIRDVKTAGYIILPFLATLLVWSPLNFLLIVGLAVVVYTTTNLVRKYTLLMGISRYAFVLVLSIILVWTVDYFLLRSTTTFSPFLGAGVLASLAIAILVNDHIIYGVKSAIPVLIVLLSLMAFFGMGSNYAAIKIANYNISTATAKNKEKISEQALSGGINLESRVLFAGDIFWGRRMNLWSQSSEYKEAYPFSRLDEFERGKYDAWVANLECPTVPNHNQSIEEETRQLKFNCPTNYLSEASKWFTVLSNANNHVNDVEGRDGLEKTRQQLRLRNIQSFGDEDPKREGDSCEVIALPARALIDGSQQQINIPITMCGYNGVSETIPIKTIEQIQIYSKFMPVIAYSHKGDEYSTKPSKGQQEKYRLMIDSGADVVFGNNSHSVLPVENYNKKLIFYSIGSFIFDQQRDEAYYGVAIDTSIHLNSKNTNMDQLKAWAKLGKVCGNYKDKCLAEASSKNLQKLPFEFTYSPVPVDLSQHTTMPAFGNLEQEIFERLEWEKVDSRLKQE